MAATNTKPTKHSKKETRTINMVYSVNVVRNNSHWFRTVYSSDFEASVKLCKDMNEEFGGGTLRCYCHLQGYWENNVNRPVKWFEDDGTEVTD